MPRYSSPTSQPSRTTRWASSSSRIPFRPGSRHVEDEVRYTPFLTRSTTPRHAAPSRTTGEHSRTSVGAGAGVRSSVFGVRFWVLRSAAELQTPNAEHRIPKGTPNLENWTAYSRDGTTDGLPRFLQVV